MTTINTSIGLRSIIVIISPTEEFQRCQQPPSFTFYSLDPSGQVQGALQKRVRDHSRVSYGGEQAPKGAELSAC